MTAARSATDALAAARVAGLKVTLSPDWRVETDEANCTDAAAFSTFVEILQTHGLQIAHLLRGEDETPRTARETLAALRALGVEVSLIEGPQPMRLRVADQAWETLPESFRTRLLADFNREQHAIFDLLQVVVGLGAAQKDTMTES